MKYDHQAARKSEGWQSLRNAAFRRSCGRCEFCGKPMDRFQLHHRWYPKKDTLFNLMAVHGKCHKIIHFGGKVKATDSSLAARKDKGTGYTRKWRDYINKQS